MFLSLGSETFYQAPALPHPSRGLQSSCRGPRNGVKFGCRGPRNGVKFSRVSPRPPGAVDDDTIEGLGRARHPTGQQQWFQYHKTIVFRASPRAPPGSLGLWGPSHTYSCGKLGTPGFYDAGTIFADLSRSRVSIASGL